MLCDECGTTGTRHFKTCSKWVRSKNGTLETIPSFSSESSASASSKDPLTAEEYANLRSAMHDKEFQSARYALTHKLRPTEVNAAVVSKSYANYLDNQLDNR